jgi:type II secretory pathway pseudopilin PulG
MMRSRLAAMVLIVLGVLLLVASSLLPALLPTRYFWTEEQAREQAAAASRHHQAMYQSANIQSSPEASESDKEHARQEAAAAKARFEHSRAALERAQFWRQTLPNILRWTAAGMATVGVLLYLSGSEPR